jgi:GNAT superfamily N-acetyltransferase
VDLRLDQSERPYVLEINPNPDISPEAGFAAALAAAGISYEQFILATLEIASGGPAEARAEPPRPAPADAAGKPPVIRWCVPSDRDKVIQMAVATGFFRPDEVEIAKEVLDDSLAKGTTGHYQSYVAEVDDRLAGWLCFGPTPCALGTYDIYWIVVAPEFQRQGIGSALMDCAEQVIRERGGRLIVVDTSSRPIYTRTRQFYLQRGYGEELRVADFYAPGDHKLIYCKRL